MNQVLTIEQKQTIYQGQILSLQILSMDTTELSDFLEKEYSENPLLEHKTGCTKSKCNRTEDDDYFSHAEIPDRRSNTVEEIILDQLDTGCFSQDDFRIVKMLVACLDENGFFKFSIADIARLLRATEEQVEECLYILKQLEPRGVFCRDVSEFLLLQIEDLEISTPKLRQFITDGLELAAAGKVGRAAKILDVPVSEVRSYMSIISGLRPYPFQENYDHDVQYIVPDVIAWQTRFGCSISLNDEWINDYQISDYYLGLYRNSDDAELKAYLKEKYQRVRSVLESIEQRRKTIQDVCKTITEIQHNYVFGAGDLQPMTMKDVASLMGVSISTVSRAISNKYIQYPGKTFLIKELFSSGVGETIARPECTADCIKKHIRKMIDEEDRKKPLSDQSIVDKLKNDGISVSRRAVAKYRTELGICCSAARRAG